MLRDYYRMDPTALFVEATASELLLYCTLTFCVQLYSYRLQGQNSGKLNCYLIFTIS